MGKIKGWKKVRKPPRGITEAWVGKRGDTVRIESPPSFWTVSHKRLGRTTKYDLGVFRTYEKAKRKAVSYMRQHPSG